MSETKHTPGPWYFDRSTGTAADCHVALFSDLIVKGKPLSEKGEIVLGCHEGMIRCHPRNACLIAASPDLLKAAKLVLKKCSFPAGAAKEKDALREAVAQAESSTIYRKATYDIKPETHARLKEMAIDRNLSLSEVVRLGLEEYVERADVAVDVVLTATGKGNPQGQRMTGHWHTNDTEN